MIYRLESAQGEGIFVAAHKRPLDPCSKIIFVHTFLNGKGPEPHEDDKLVENCRKRGIDVNDLKKTDMWRFGFASKKSLFQWFSKDVVAQIIENGGRLVKITGVSKNEIVLGDNQLVFPKKAYENSIREPVTLS